MLRGLSGQAGPRARVAGALRVGDKESGLSGAFVYVSNAESRDIHVFRLNAVNGALEPVQVLKLEVPGPVMPLAVSPDRRFLYAAQRGQPYTVASIAIDGTEGSLSPLGYTAV